MIYAIFTYYAGKWTMYESGYRTLANAKQELDYVVNSLGLQAKIFCKGSWTMFDSEYSPAIV